jgi:hemin uptake protein HemP
LTGTPRTFDLLKENRNAVLTTFSKLDRESHISNNTRPLERAAPPEYLSRALLKDAGQATIVHRGQCYILRETRAGKLILCK